MMCQRIGRPPISIIGLGLRWVSSAILVPNPPAKITAFIFYLMKGWERTKQLPLVRMSLNFVLFASIFMYFRFTSSLFTAILIFLLTKKFSAQTGTQKPKLKYIFHHHSERIIFEDFGPIKKLLINLLKILFKKNRFLS